MKLGEVVELLEKRDCRDEYLIPFGEDLVILYKPFLEFKNNSGTYYAADGIYCSHNDFGSFDADWSLTWIWENKEHPENYLYYEQDDILISLHNLFHGTEGTINDWEAQELL